MDWVQIVTYVLSAVVAVGGALLSVIAHFKKGGAEHELKVAKEVFSNTLKRRSYTSNFTRFISPYI